MNIEGVVNLPNSIMVTMDALGRTYSGSIALGKFNITLPIHAPEQEEDELLPPRASNEDLARDVFSATQWGRIGARHRSEGPKTAHVTAVAVRGEVEGELDGELTQRFDRQFNKWYRTLVEWVEVWTQQLLDTGSRQTRRMEFSVWDLSDSTPRRTGVGYGPSIRFRDPETAAKTEHLTAAAAQATNNHRLPDEWSMLMSAERSTQGRLRVIEAATAAEMAMSSAIERRLPGLSTDAITAIIKNANGAAGLVKLLDVLDGRPGQKRGRVFNLLAGPRNLAVHNGKVPDKSTADAALHTAQELLTEFSPLPGPREVLNSDTRESDTPVR